MRSGREETTRRWVETVTSAVRAALAGAVGARPGRRWQPDPSARKALRLALRLAADRAALRASLDALPDDALVAVQNVGREAYVVLLTRVAHESPYREKLTAFLEHEGRRRGLGQVEAGSVVNASLTLLIERAAAHWPTFADPRRVYAFLKSYCNNKLWRKARDGPARRGREAAAGLQAARDRARDQPGSVGTGYLADLRRAEERRLHEDFDAGLRELPLEQRVAYRLSKRPGWSYADTAELLWGPYPPDGNRPDSYRKKAERMAVKAELLVIEATCKLDELRRRRPEGGGPDAAPG